MLSFAVLDFRPSQAQLHSWITSFEALVLEPTAYQLSSAMVCRTTPSIVMEEVKARGLRRMLREWCSHSLPQPEASYRSLIRPMTFNYCDYGRKGVKLWLFLVCCTMRCRSAQPLTGNRFQISYGCNSRSAKGILKSKCTACCIVLWHHDNLYCGGYFQPHGHAKPRYCCCCQTFETGLQCSVLLCSGTVLCHHDKPAEPETTGLDRLWNSCSTGI